MVVMHHLDSIPNQDLKVHLMPLIHSRHHETLAYLERKKYALDPDSMPPRIPNHVFHGISGDFLSKIKNNEPAFQAEIDFVVTEINKVLNDTSSHEAMSQADKLYAELGVGRSTQPEQVNKRIRRAAIAMLASNRPTIFSRKAHKFAAFIKERKGVWGSSVVDWSYGGINEYLDKAYRDISEHRMYQEFWTTKADPDQNQKYKYHTEDKDGSHLGVEHAMNTLFEEAARENGDFNLKWLGTYLDEIRGRSVTDETIARELVGGIARFQYMSKLGNPATLIRNATILGSLAMVLGPKHVLKTIMGLHIGYADKARRARRTGAASPAQDIAFEFESHTASNTKTRKKVSKFLANLGLFVFSKEEIMLRTVTSHVALSAFEANVSALKGTASDAEMSIYGLTADEARHNLMSMLEFTKEEVAQLEKGVDAQTLEEFEDRAMYHGSNMVNFRSGPNYLPPILAGQGSMARFVRVFNSFAYNIIVAQGKHIWSDIGDGKTPGARRGGIRRMVGVYGGALITAQIANALLNAVGDKDDEDDLKGDSAMTKFAFNRLRDLSTVGLFGKLDKPYDFANPKELLLGVHGRTMHNLGRSAQGATVGFEDYFNGDFGEGTRQLFDTAARLLTAEITHIRGARQLYNKWGVNRRDYDIARQVNRSLSEGKKSMSEKAADRNKNFGVATYQKERDSVVNKLASGDYFDAGSSAGAYVRRILGREDGLTVEKAVQRARASVMMKAPLSEFSTSSDPKKANEDLKAFAGEINKRRGTSETRRLIAAHLAYVGAVEAIFPRK